MVNRRKKDLTYLGVFILVIIISNVTFSSIFTRFDFTKEGRYTLSPITKELLNGLKDNIQISVYLDGDVPPNFKRLRNATKDILVDFRAYSHGNLHFDFINPLQGDADAQQTNLENLISYGLEPLNLTVKTTQGESQKIVFPAALVTYQGTQIPVKLFQDRKGLSAEEILNNSVQNLEYALASAIKKAVAKGKPRIGFTEGHGELTDLQLSDAMATLSDGYNVGRVNLDSITFSGLDKLKLLVIPKPGTAFTEAQKYKIDYFVMRGGRVFWAIDNVNAELDSLKQMSEQLTFPKKLNLDDILFKYGIRINYDLIADLNAGAIPINTASPGQASQIHLAPWLFYPIFVPTSQHPLVKNLDGIKSEFASTIDTIGIKGVNKQVILRSSPLNTALSTPFMISLQMVDQQPDPREFRNPPKTVAVLLEGNFPSDFKGRPVPAGIGETVTIPEKSPFTKMVVIGDGDVLKNQISDKDQSPYPLGFDRYTNVQYGNKNLLLNIADYLTDDSGLIQLRTKEIRLRLLDKAKISQEKTLWQALNICMPVLIIILFGIFQHYYRKRKYAH